MPEEKDKMFLEDLCPAYSSSNTQTAFIGRCGSDRGVPALYLIFWGHIVRADNNLKTWSERLCSVQIDHFVDVEIRVKE